MPSSSQQSYESDEEEEAQQAERGFDDDDDEGYLEAIGDFKPGTITRIELENFMTHTRVTLLPGSRLNMVIGANGTGKSTILNAICLGLGGDAKMLGRADDLRAFISHGKQMAKITIHLAPLPGRQPHVLSRILDANKGSAKGKGKGASTCFINGQKASDKQVRALVSGVYHISIENLCTFLPQDKVGDFSGFNDQRRLLETEKTFSYSGAGDDDDDDDEEEEGTNRSEYYYNLHQQLIKAEEDLANSKGNVETVQDRLSKLEQERQQLKREKERMEERQKALDQVHFLQQKMLWLKYEDTRQKAAAAKEERDKFKKKAKEAAEKVKPFQEKVTQLGTQKKEYDQQAAELNQQIERHKKEMSKQIEKYNKHDDAMEESAAQLAEIESRRTKLERQVAESRKAVEHYEGVGGTFPPEEEIRSKLDEAKESAVRARQAYDQAKRQEKTQRQRFGELEEAARKQQATLTRLSDSAARRKDKILRNNGNLNTICQWLDSNRTKFRRQVWGPIACEVNPQSSNSAAFLEFHVANRILTAFVVETQEDYDLLFRTAREHLKVNVNIIKVNNGRLKPITRLYSDQKMQVLKQQHGVVGYLDETFTAPDPVMQALRSYGGVEKVIVGGEETQKSVDQRNLLGFMNEPDAAGPNPDKRQNGCVFASQGNKSSRYIVSMSRYAKGPRDKANRDVSGVRPPRMLDAGTNPRVLEENKEKLDKLHEEMNALRPSLEEAHQQVITLENTSQEAQLDLKNAHGKVKNFQKFQSRLIRAKNKLKDDEDALQTDDGQDKDRLVKALFGRMNAGIGALTAHKDERRKMIEATIASSGAMIAKSVAGAAERNAKQTLASKLHECEGLRIEHKRLVDKYTKLRQSFIRAKEEAEKKAPLLDANGDELPLKEKLESMEVDTYAEAEAALEDAEQMVQQTQANEDVFRQYENLEKEIESVQADLDELSSSKEAKLAMIQEKRKPWEAALTNHIAKINKKFAHYMKEMSCTGEVRLKKGTVDEASQEENETFANFRDWGIEILVSYREGSKAQILSAERHSGGERSVATILYLMAIQDLMSSPFRCVDEINQGLDARNERLVFKRIVTNSTGRPKEDRFDHSGQYFLITPKLLPDLVDMENEAVSLQIVMNGAQNLASPTDWNMTNLMASAAPLVSPSPGKRAHAETVEASENSRNGVRPRNKRSRRSQPLANAEE